MTTTPEPGPVRMRGRSAHATYAMSLKDVVRDVLGLAADHTVVVKELACAEPGCPPTETVIAVWPATGLPRRWTLHQPLADVTPDDVRAALAAPDETASARTTTTPGDHP